MLKLGVIISSRKEIRATVCSTLLLFSVCHNIFNAESAEAIGLPATSKNTPMLLPSYEKLFQGSGPTTNDNKEKAQSEKQLDSSDNADLSPMTLTDTATTKQADESNDDTTNGAVLKSTVSTTDYVPKNGDADVMEAKSIKSNHKK